MKKSKLVNLSHPTNESRTYPLCKINKIFNFLTYCFLLLPPHLLSRQKAFAFPSNKLNKHFRHRIHFLSFSSCLRMQQPNTIWKLIQIRRGSLFSIDYYSKTLHTKRIMPVYHKNKPFRVFIACKASISPFLSLLYAYFIPRVSFDEFSHPSYRLLIF